MKKHNEGYVLPFVLVVLVVVCLVAVSLLTASLDSLKRQQSSIDHMKDQYAAQGLIEQDVAMLTIGVTSDPIEGGTGTTLEEARSAAFSAAIDKLGDKEENYTPSGNQYQYVSNKTVYDDFKRTSGSVKVEAGVTATKTTTIEVEIRQNGDGNYTATASYTIAYSDLIYTSYTISHEEVVE